MITKYPVLDLAIVAFLIVGTYYLAKRVFA